MTRAEGRKEQVGWLEKWAGAGERKESGPSAGGSGLGPGLGCWVWFGLGFLSSFLFYF